MLEQDLELISTPVPKISLSSSLTNTEAISYKSIGNHLLQAVISLSTPPLSYRSDESAPSTPVKKDKYFFEELPLEKSLQNVEINDELEEPEDDSDDPDFSCILYII